MKRLAETANHRRFRRFSAMTVKKESKKSYLARRKARVRELYVSGHMEPRDIARVLVENGTIETTDESLESAVRIVRGDVAEIRDSLISGRIVDSDPKVALTEIDALELELLDLRRERDRQRLIADGEPIEMCAVSRWPIAACAAPECLAAGHRPFFGPSIGVTITDTPQGAMTSYKALWPAGVRQKASKDASSLTKDISMLEAKIAEKRKGLQPVAGRTNLEAETFAFNFPNVTGQPGDLDAMIALNLDRAKVN